MNYPQDYRPPYLAIAFFRWFCNPEFREDIEGDLLERFEKRVTELGDRKAKWLFIKDVFFLFRSGIIGDLKPQSQYKFMNMKKVNWIKLIGLNLLVVLMMVSPFIPGPSNKLVGAFSFVGQLTGLLGLLLVPVGLAWTIIEIRKLRETNEKVINQGSFYRLAIAATLMIALILLLAVVFVPNPMPKMSFLFGLLLMLSGFILALRQIRKWRDKNERIPDQGALIILAVSATAWITFLYLFTLLFFFVMIGIIPGILGLLLLPIGLYWALKKIRELKEVKERKFNRVPLYFLTIPLIAFLTWMFIIEPASDFSRNFAIKRCEVLISSIEEYKNKEGKYPESIHDLEAGYIKKIPSPSIMGIQDFRYNKIKDYYSISFSQWLHLGSLEEIVLYDKNDVAKMRDALPPYTYDHDLHRVKGAFANFDTRHSNWRYYHVD